MGGGSGLIEVDGVPVFAKRIPLTDLELNAFYWKLFGGEVHAEYPGEPT